MTIEDMGGIKELVKKGELDPKDALTELRKKDYVSPKILSWLRTTGVKRFKEAIAKKHGRNHG